MHVLDCDRVQELVFKICRHLCSHDWATLWSRGGKGVSLLASSCQTSDHRSPHTFAKEKVPPIFSGAGKTLSPNPTFAFSRLEVHGFFTSREGEGVKNPPGDPSRLCFYGPFLLQSFRFRSEKAEKPASHRPPSGPNARSTSRAENTLGRSFRSLRAMRKYNCFLFGRVFSNKF